MRTMKGSSWRLGLWGALLGAVWVFSTTIASAQTQTATCSDEISCVIATDRAASLLVYPKIVVDTSNGVDTIIQLTHTSDRRTVDVLCFWVNANGRCAATGAICQSHLDCQTGDTCVAGWEQRDFRLTLTKRQPVSWKASEGASFLPCDPAAPDAGSCIVDDQGQPIFNSGSVPPVQEDPFVGELKCIQIDENDRPVDFNELKGEATIVRTRPGTGASGGVDVAKYNAVGIQAIPGRNDQDNVLCIGGDSPTGDCPQGAEYAACPQVLIMNHFFEGATEGATQSTVRSNLTLVPCAQDFETGVNNLATRTTVQFLIFNEFEQRTSTSYRIACFDERPLADIDTRPGPADDQWSIFSIGTQGTLTGQTRLRPVSVNGEARGFLAVLEEFHDSCSNSPDGVCTAMVGLHYQGKRTLPDLVRLP